MILTVYHGITNGNIKACNNLKWECERRRPFIDGKKNKQKAERIDNDGKFQQGGKIVDKSHEAL